MLEKDKALELVLGMIARREVNILSRAAQKLECSDLDVARLLPPAHVCFARTEDLRSLWAEMVSWPSLGVMMSLQGFSLESKGQLGPLDERGGMMHFYGKALAGHLAPEKIAAIAFVQLPVGKYDTYSLRFFGRDGKTIVSFYVDRDKKGKLLPECLERYQAARERYAVAGAEAVAAGKAAGGAQHAG